MNRIQKKTNSHDPLSPPLDVPYYSLQLKKNIKSLSSLLSELLEAPNLSEEMEFLSKIKGAIQALAEISNTIK